MTLINRFSGGLLISSVVLAASLVLGIASGAGYLSFRVLLVILFSGVALIVLAAGEKGFEVGMLIWVLLFALGYRTVQISTYFRLHPLIMLIYLLGVLYLLQSRLSAERSAPNLAFQMILFIGLFFWVNGWLQGLLRGRRWDLMITEALNFLAIVPIFALVRHTANKPVVLRRMLQFFYSVGVFIAATGIFEYFFSDVARRALAGISRTDSIVFVAGVTGFERAGFVTWGSPAAAFICMLALPMALPCLAWAKGALGRIFVIAGAISLLIAIYISGYRSLWMLTGILVAVALLSRRNLIIMVLGAAVAAFAISLIPEAGQERLTHAIEVIQGISYDNSILTREERFNNAVATGLTYPLGVGWGGTGWVHSDLAQVTGNLGVAAGILFALWYVYTLSGIWRLQQKYLTDPAALALLCSFIGVGGLLLLQGVQVLPQLIMPCWFIWAVVYAYTKQVKAVQHAV